MCRWLLQLTRLEMRPRASRRAQTWLQLRVVYYRDKCAAVKTLPSAVLQLRGGTDAWLLLLKLQYESTLVLPL